MAGEADDAEAIPHRQKSGRYQGRNYCNISAKISQKNMITSNLKYFKNFSFSQWDNCKNKFK